MKSCLFVKGGFFMRVPVEDGLRLFKIGFVQIQSAQYEIGCNWFYLSEKQKKRTRIKIQSRFKIQYPMKNRDEDKGHKIEIQYSLEYI